MSNIDELKSTGLKATLPRLKILDVFHRGAQRHMTAEDVFRVLLEERSDIGLATVYRVLTQFEQAGILSRSHFESGKAVYELNEGTHHDHLVCLDCGKVDEFYDADRLSALQERVDERTRATVLVGWGADLAARRRADALVLVDMARWEIQQRLRAGASNWRAHNGELDVLRKYKRGFFVEWRTADRHKRTLLDRLDLLVDGNAAQDEAGAVRSASPPDESLIRLLLTARRWWAELAKGEFDITALSVRENVSASWMTRVVRLAFLAPDVVEAVLAGKTKVGIDAKALLTGGAIPSAWAKQAELLLPVTVMPTGRC